MSEYLTKEEIRQWRSSLEKITLEEYAARLGKKLEEEKETEDIGDVVMHRIANEDYTSSYNPPPLEKIITIGSKAFSKEKEIVAAKKSPAVKKPVKKAEKAPKIKVKVEQPIEDDGLNISFSKNPPFSGSAAELTFFFSYLYSQ